MAQSGENIMRRYNPTLPWAAYETVYTFPDHWDLESPQSEQQIVDYYEIILNQQLQQMPSIYAAITTHSSSGSDSSSLSDSSSPHELSAQRLSTSKRPTSCKQERRREQNRLSQRAYRERKEMQIKAMAEEIAQWKAKHEGLIQTYSSQSSEMQKLKVQIEHLTNRIIAAQQGILDH